MKTKLFKQGNQEKNPDEEKRNEGTDALQRAQIILDEIKASMAEFGSELDEALKQAAK